MYNFALILSAAVLAVSAAPIRRQTDQKVEIVANVTNSLKSIYRLAAYVSSDGYCSGRVMPVLATVTLSLQEMGSIDMSDFEPVCNTIGQLNMIEVQLLNETEAQEHNETQSNITDTDILQLILAVGEGLKRAACAWVCLCLLGVVV